MKPGGIIDTALDTVFPPRCMICLDLIPLNMPRWVCGSCDGLLQPIDFDLACARCGAPAAGKLCVDCSDRKTRDFLDGNRALFIYDEFIRSAVHNLKFGRRPDIARGMAYFAAKHSRDYFTNADCIAFVPLHKKRRAKRGFNQAESIAIEISNATGVPLIRPLTRKRDTKPQSSLDYVSRIKNMSDAFDIAGDYDIKAKKIIIIDDIYTTGATLNACAEALKSRFAAETRGFTVAVAVRGADDNDGRF